MAWSSEYTSLTLERVRLPIAIAAATVLLTRLFTLPQTFWQSEELRFARALLTFDPLQQQPEPPGYPLYIALGRLINVFVRNPFPALVALSLIAVVCGAYLVGLIAAECFSSDWTGAAAVLLLYFSPAMLVFDSLPNPEGLAVALIAAAFFALIRGRTFWFGVAAGAAVAVRPEIALAMVALLLFKPRALIAFIVIVIVAFIPLVEAIGVPNLAPYAKTNYHALRTSSDAAGLHGRELLLRFVAHPWGAKWTSFPLLLIALTGAVLYFRRFRAFIAFAAVHVAFCLLFADRADGVQPVVPALIAVAILATAALSSLPPLALGVACVYAIAGFAYAWPVLHQRHTSPSPPARAMRFVRRSVPQEGVLLYEPSMDAWAHQSRTTVAPIREFDRYADRKETPLFILADGGSRSPLAVRFEWPDSDAYGKITTERYRIASIIPYPPPARYRSLGGVYAFERTPDGREWRWLADDAVIELPSLGAKIVRVTLALPDDAPIEENEIQINQTTFVVRRGQQVTVAVPAAPLLRIHSAKKFTSERDRRELAVQLIGVKASPFTFSTSGGESEK